MPELTTISIEAAGSDCAQSGQGSGIKPAAPAVRVYKTSARQRELRKLRHKLHRGRDSAYNKAWSKTHPESRRATHRRWAEKNREHLRKCSREYASRQSTKNRHAELYRIGRAESLGITLDEYLVLKELCTQQAAYRKAHIDWYRPSGNPHHRTPTYGELIERRRIARRKYRLSHSEKHRAGRRRYRAKHRKELNRRRSERAKIRLAEYRETHPLPPRPRLSQEELLTRKHAREAARRASYRLTHPSKATPRKVGATPEEEHSIVLYRAKRRRLKHRRRARAQGSGGSYSKAEWDAICRHFAHHCPACGSPGPLTVDHVIPLVLGGSNSVVNIQPLCKPCNVHKGTSIADYRITRLALPRVSMACTDG